MNVEMQKQADIEQKTIYVTNLLKKQQHNFIRKFNVQTKSKIFGSNNRSLKFSGQSYELTEFVTQISFLRNDTKFGAKSVEIHLYYEWITHEFNDKNIHQFGSNHFKTIETQQLFKLNKRNKKNDAAFFLCVRFVARIHCDTFHYSVAVVLVAIYVYPKFV